jgi:hypothetical protein
MAVKTLVLIWLDTLPVPFTTRDTVAVETAARLATSFIVLDIILCPSGGMVGPHTFVATGKRGAMLAISLLQLNQCVGCVLLKNLKSACYTTVKSAKPPAKLDAKWWLSFRFDSGRTSLFHFAQAKGRMQRPFVPHSQQKLNALKSEAP